MLGEGKTNLIPSNIIKYSRNFWLYKNAFSLKQQNFCVSRLLKVSCQNNHIHKILLIIICTDLFSLQFSCHRNQPTKLGYLHTHFKFPPTFLLTVIHKVHITLIRFFKKLLYNNERRGVKQILQRFLQANSSSEIFQRVKLSVS